MKYLGVIVVLVIFLQACTSRQVEPNKASRKEIDTLYQKKFLFMQPQLDSFCQVMRDSLFMPTVDSMLALRRAEMIDLVQ